MKLVNLELSDQKVSIPQHPLMSWWQLGWFQGAETTNRIYKLISTQSQLRTAIVLGCLPR